MDSERDKESENPYRSPASRSDAGLRTIRNAIEHWIGVLILGINATLAVVVIGVLVFLFWITF